MACRALFTALLVVATACSRAGFGVDANGGPLRVVGAPLLDFGATAVGFTSELLLELDASEQIAGLTAQVAGPFAFAGGTFPGARGSCTEQLFGPCTLDLVFAPVANGSFQALLTLSYVARNQSFALRVVLTGAGSEVGTVADADHSSISATSPVSADGIAASLITVVLRDARDLPVPGKTVTLEVTGSNNQLTPCSPGDGAGRSSCALRSTSVEDKIVNTSAPVVLGGVSVSFIDRSVARVAFTRQPTYAGPNGVLGTMPEVSLYDASDNLLVGEAGVVTLSVVSDGGLSGDLARVPVAGVVDFAGAALRVERTGTLRLAARAANGVTAESDPFDVPAPGLAKAGLRSGPIRGRGHVDGSLTTARVHAPRYAVSNGSDIYFSETKLCTVRAMNIASGAVRTVVGSPYQCDGIVEGAGPAARLMGPAGLAISGGNLYIADVNAHVVMRVDLNNNGASLYAGTPRASGTVNGDRLGSLFSQPTSLALDAGNLYIGNCGDCTLRRLSLTSDQVDTLAGSTCGFSNGQGSGAQFGCIADIEMTPTGIYVLHDVVHRRVTVDGTVSTTLTNVLGSTNLGYDSALNAIFFNSFDSIFSYEIDTGNVAKPQIGLSDVNRYVDSSLADSRFFDPTDVVAVSNGVFIFDSGNSAIRLARFDNDTVTTRVGLSGAGLGQQGGVGTEARWQVPRGMAADGDGLYVGEDERIVRIEVATMLAQDWAGSSQDDAGVVDGPRGDARIQQLHDMTSDGRRIFFTDFRQVRVLDPDETVRTIAGVGASGFRDGVGTGARFAVPDVLTYHRGKLFVEDSATIRTVDPRSGSVVTVFGARDRFGCLDTDGATNEPGSIQDVRGMAAMGNTLYVIDCDRLRAVDLTTFSITTLTSDVFCDVIDGVGLDASLGCGALRLTSDGSALYVVNFDHGVVQRIVPGFSGPAVTVFSGDVLDQRDFDSSVAASRFIEPSLAYFGFGQLWIANAFGLRAIQ